MSHSFYERPPRPKKLTVSDEQCKKEGPILPTGLRSIPPSSNGMDGCLVLVAICMFGFFFVYMAVQAVRETFGL